MCNVCWEAYAAGQMTRTEVWQCVYYLDIIRNHKDELNARPKRDPDDPYYCLQYGEGLLPWMFTREEEDFYIDEIYRRVRKARIYRLKASGKGAERSRRESATRGVEDETNGWPKLHDFYE